jgi:hypothetical protein|tara:strand:- start:934 stop:1782 length:849 start_codon:yes stop_codon:yes gene_type:complete
MIIWLASYPKSGNTWLRSMISALMYSKDGLFNFNLLSHIKQFPSKSYLKNFTNNFGNFNEVKKYFVSAQEFLNLDNKVKFLKTHHINCKIGEHNFTNRKNTLATIYVVRDPRNLVSSISNHMSLSLEDSKDFLLKPKLIVGSTNKQKKIDENDLKILIGTWAEHYKFWKYNNENFLIIKYEDLVNDVFYELNKIIKFLEKFVSVESNDNKIQNIINTTGFEFLKKLEKKGNFNENATDEFGIHKEFFHLGPGNKWQDILDKKIVDEIEKKLSKEMVELGYLK